MAVLNGSTLYYLHTDHLGTPQLATDSNQAVAWQASYDPFGQASVSGTITQNLRFPGQYFDVESGWNHNGFRDYAPELGRYIEPDPLGLNGGDINLYTYVAEDPINETDPLGLYHCVGGANCTFTPPMQEDLACFDRCTHRANAITSGYRQGQHNQHGSCQAADMSRHANPSLSRDDAAECTRECFRHGYGQEEYNSGNVGTHFHLQLDTVPVGRPGYFGNGIQPYHPTR